MITQLRKKLSGTLTHIFMFIAVFGLLGLFSLPSLIKQGTKAWVMKINNIEVSRAEYEQEINRQTERIAAFKQQYGQFADMLLGSMGMSSDPKMLAVDIITQKTLLAHFARFISLRISEDYAHKQLANQNFSQQYLGDIVPYFLYDKNGEIQTMIFRVYLQKWGLSLATFLSKVTESITRSIAINLVNYATYVPSHEQELFLSSQHYKKNLDLLVLNHEDFIREAKKITPSFETLEQFFKEKNKTAQTYFVPEKRDVTVWTFDYNSYNTVISNDQITEYYNKHKSQKFVARQAEVTVRKIVFNEQPVNGPSIADIHQELLKDPSLFVEYTKKYSQDKTSTKKGSSVETLVYGKSHSPLYKAAFGLKNIGDISPVLSIDGSFVIVQLVTKEQKQYHSIESVKKDIVSALKKQAFKSTFPKELRKVLKDGVIDQNELESLIKIHNPTKKSLKGITKQVRDNNNDPVAKVAFSINTEGNAQLLVREDEAMVIVLNHVNQRFLPDINTIIETVKADWYSLQGSLALQKMYAHIQKELAQKSLREVAKSINIPIKQIAIDGAHDKIALKKFEELGLPKDDILMNMEKEDTFYCSMTSSIAFFVHCTECTKNTNHNSVTKEEKAALEQGENQLIIEGLIASLHRDAKIETNESFTLPLEDYII